jgi:hypothetical protein
MREMEWWCLRLVYVNRESARRSEAPPYRGLAVTGSCRAIVRLWDQAQPKLKAQGISNRRFNDRRLLMCRLYVGLIRSLNEDYGSDLASHSDSCTDRAIGIYVFLKTIMGTPARATRIAQALKLPRVTVNRRLQGLIKRGGAGRQCPSGDRQGQHTRLARQARTSDRLNHRDGG